MKVKVMAGHLSMFFLRCGLFLFDFYSSIFHIYMHLFYTCQPLLYFVVISYILLYLVVQIQQGWWRIISQLHACLFVRRGQEDPPVLSCWGLWVFGLAKR